MKRCENCNLITTDEHTFCPNDGRQLVADEVATRLQEALGTKYSLTELIGKGAMGAVYKARHRDLDDVAIKVMLGPPDNQQLSERFIREARALRKLRHQHAVTIYDVDRSTPGLTYMVMEMVAGSNLREDLRERGRLNLDEVMEIAGAVCGALQAAHERGIIHRDIKPDNILMAEETTITGKVLRTIKIADFGIVKLRGNQRGGEASLKLTQYGTPIGTPFYMSPEQWFGEGAGITALDGRTDIYAFGCTLYELLAGRTPFMGNTTSDLRRQHLEREATPLHLVAKNVPEPISRVIMRSLAKDRDERFQSAAEFMTELKHAYDESFGKTASTTRSQLLSKQLTETIDPAQQTDTDTPSPRADRQSTMEVLPFAQPPQLFSELARTQDDQQEPMPIRLAKAVEEARRRIDEEQRQAEEGVRLAEEAGLVEEARLAEEARAAEEARRQTEEEERQRAEQEARERAEAAARRQAEEAEAKRRAEEEARRKEEEARLRAEEEARRAAEEAARLAEEKRLRDEAEAHRRAEEEAARLRAEEEARRKAEEELRLAAEAEARRLAEEEARRRAEEEETARRKAEAEAARLRADEARRAEEARLKAEQEAARRVEEERARRIAQEQARLNAEARRRAEEEESARQERERREREERERAASVERERIERERHELEEEERARVLAAERGAGEATMATGVPTLRDDEPAPQDEALPMIGDSPATIEDFPPAPMSAAALEADTIEKVLPVEQPAPPQGNDNQASIFGYTSGSSNFADDARPDQEPFDPEVTLVPGIIYTPEQGEAIDESDAAPQSLARTGEAGPAQMIETPAQDEEDSAVGQSASSGPQPSPEFSPAPVYKPAPDYATWTPDAGTAHMAGGAPTGRRHIWIIGLLIVSLLVVVGVTSLLGVYLYRRIISPAGQTTEQVAVDEDVSSVLASAAKGTITVSAPQGSEVFIDDEKAGATGSNGQFTTEALAGLRNIRVAKTGSRPWIKDTKVDRDATVRVSARPQREQKSQGKSSQERRSFAERYLRSGNYYGAEVEYRELLVDNPNDAEIHSGMAEALNAQQRYAEALGEYEEALRLQPDNIETILSLGQIYEIKRRDADAESTFARAVQLQPKNASAQALLAWVLLRRGKLEQASAAIEQALQIKADPEYMDTKAHILLARGQTDDALKLAESNAQKSKDPAFQATLAIILQRAGKESEAVAAYRQLRQSGRDDEWGDLKRLMMFRGYGKSALETLAKLITATN